MSKHCLVYVSCHKVMFFVFDKYVKGTFLLRTFYWGQAGVRENYKLQIRKIVTEAYKSLGDTPVVIGECGVPMDMKYVCTNPFTSPSH